MRTSTDSSLTLCSVVSAQSGEDPAGSAWANARYFLIEVPLPWPNNMLESRKLPPGINALVQQLFEEGIYWGWIGIAPDPEYTVEGMTRVVDVRLPDAPPFQRYARTEYLFPTDRAGELAALMVRTPDAPALLPYREDVAPNLRDLLVCTHGTVDVCCATFGYPIYKLLRQMTPPAHQPTRVWRCTHFGGHRFAATLLDLPSGRYWGRLQAHDLAHLLRRDVPFAELRHAYRGWSALPHPSQQIAEAELFRRLDWAWEELAVSPVGPLPDDLEPDSAHTVSFAVSDERTGREGLFVVQLTPGRRVRTLQVSLTDAYVDAQQYDAQITAGPTRDFMR